jgi:hypothetical protein
MPDQETGFGFTFNPTEELGTSGLPRQAGQVTDEFLRDLQGVKGLKAFREMRDNEAIVGAVLMAIRNLGASVDWPVVPAGDQPGDRELADTIDGALKRDMALSWADMLSEIYSMNWAGYSWFEVVYKRREGQTGKPETNSIFEDGLIGWRKWAFRSQSSRVRWMFDDHGGVQGFVQRVPMLGDVEIPIEKSLLFRTQTEMGNPEGRSLLRNAYIPWLYKRRIENFEAIGIERDLAGLPVVQIKTPTKDAPGVPDPWNTKNPDAVNLLANLEKMVQTIRRNERSGYVLPWFVELKLLSSQGQQRNRIGETIGRYTAAIAQSMLADFMMLGQTQSGSRALAEPKIDLFLGAVNGINQRIAAVINRFAIPPLARLNGVPPQQPLPRIEPKDVKTVDLAELGEYITKLTASGLTIFPSADGEMERAALEAADLPNDAIVDAAVQAFKDSLDGNGRPRRGITLIPDDEIDEDVDEV